MMDNKSKYYDINLIKKYLNGLYGVFGLYGINVNDLFDITDKEKHSQTKEND